jgi:hypothetical protein
VIGRHVRAADRQEAAAPAERALSLFEKGLPTAEISAPFAEIPGASVSKETILRLLRSWRSER